MLGIHHVVASWDRNRKIPVMRASMILAFLVGIGLHTPSLVAASPLVPPQETNAAPAREVAIDDFSWLIGFWRGTGLGGECEEIWSPPFGGTMMGSFRLVKNGKVSFYEIMVLGKDDRGWALKVKHFTEAFVSWEDKEDCVRFALESVDKNEATFGGLRFQRRGDDLTISLRMRSRDGTVAWQGFALKRRPLEPAAEKVAEESPEDELVIDVTGPHAKSGIESSRILVDGLAVDFRALREHLLQWGCSNPERRDPSNPRLSRTKLTIRCAPEQAFDYVKAILQLCSEPKIAIYRIAIAVPSGERVRTPLPTDFEVDPKQPSGEVVVKLRQAHDDPRPIRERPTLYHVGKEPLAKDERRRLEQLHDAFIEAPRGARVVIDAGIGVPHARVLRVVEVAHEAGIEHVLFRGNATSSKRNIDWFARIRGQLEAPDRRRSTAEKKLAVDGALAWLASKQSADGAWRSEAGDDGVRATGLALLAFLGSGQTHNTGPQKTAVRKGLAYLSRLLRDDASMSGESPAGRRAHLVAALAMTEAYGLTRSPIFQGAAERAAAQVFRPTPEAALSRLSDDAESLFWATLLAASCRLSGIETGANMLDPLVEWCRKNTDAATGRIHGKEQDLLTAAGLLARVSSGDAPDDPDVSKAAAALREMKLDPDGSPLLWYARTLTAYQVLESWKTWHPALKQHVVETIREVGSWPPRGGESQLTTTALLTLACEVYYRYARVAGLR